MEKLVIIQNLFCEQEGVELSLPSDAGLVRHTAFKKRFAAPLAIAKGRKFRRVFDKNKFRF